MQRVAGNRAVATLADDDRDARARAQLRDLKPADTPGYDWLKF